MGMKVYIDGAVWYGAAKQMLGGAAASFVAYKYAPHFGLDQKTVGVVAATYCLSHAVLKSWVVNSLRGAVYSGLQKLEKKRYWPLGNVVSAVSLPVIDGAHSLASVTISQSIALRKDMPVSWIQCSGIGFVAWEARNIFVILLDKILPS